MTDLSNIHMFPFYSDLLLPWHYSIHIHVCENSGMPYEVMAHYHKCEDDTFAVDDLVFVSTADLLLLKGQAMTLLPKYVGPFKIIEAYQGTFSYKVELLAQLQAWNLHDRFHQSKLHSYSIKPIGSFKVKKFWPITQPINWYHYIFLSYI